MSMFKSRRARIAAVVGAVLAVSAGTAVATTLASSAYTDASGAYHGCVNAASGILRVVTPDGSCRSNEVGIDWSRTGPQGIQGPQGPAGSYATGQGIAIDPRSNTLSVAPSSIRGGLDSGLDRVTNEIADGTVTAADLADGATAANVQLSYPLAYKSIEPGRTISVYATCADGQKLVSGGYGIGNVDLNVLGSYPEPGIGAPQQSWEVDVLNAGSSAANAYAYAVCMG